MQCHEDMHFIIQGRPAVLGSSKFLVTETYLKGEAKVNWDVAKKRVIEQTVEIGRNSDGTPKFGPRGMEADAYDLTWREFSKSYLKTDSVRMQKTCMQHFLHGSKKLSVSQKISRLNQLNGYFSSCLPCTDRLPFPEYDLKDILLFMCPPGIQIKVKSNHDYEGVNLTRVGEFIEQHETEAMIDAAGTKKKNNNEDEASTQDNSKKRKNSNSDSNSKSKRLRKDPPKRKEQHREIWCRYCSNLGKGYAAVHSHTDDTCHLKKGESISNKKYKKDNKKLFTIVADLQKKMKKHSKKDKYDSDSS